MTFRYLNCLVKGIIMAKNNPHSDTSPTAHLRCEDSFRPLGFHTSPVPYLTFFGLEEDLNSQGNQGDINLFETRCDKNKNQAANLKK